MIKLATRKGGSMRHGGRKQHTCRLALLHRVFQEAQEMSGHGCIQATMVLITARLERARFCSEQTQHHWREGSDLQIPKFLDQHLFPEDSQENQGNGSAEDWCSWVWVLRFLLCPSHPRCWGSPLESWGHCSSLTPGHCRYSAPLNDMVPHWGKDLSYY